MPLEFERDITPCTSGYRDPDDLDVLIGKIDARIAEVEADLEELGGAPAEAPSPVTVPLGAPANDAAPAAAPTHSEYMTTREAAVVGVSVKGLESLRARRKGPPFVRVGNAVRYRREDLHRSR